MTTATITTKDLRVRAKELGLVTTGTKAELADRIAAATKPVIARAKSTVFKDGEMTCAGPCGETKPVTKFPTFKDTSDNVVRRSVCRSCRDAK